MEDPGAEIPGVIHGLTETSPSEQQATIDRYFTPDAEFTHPFCRTGHSSYSTYLISRIYRWYKIMSPRISMKVHSVSWDKANNVVYVGISQVFAIWIIPTHRAEVSLVTVLHLREAKGIEGGKRRWLIASQNDLYQTDQFVKFVLPWFSWIVPLVQFVATLFCVVASYIFAPLTWWEETQQTNYKRVEAPPAWDDGK